MARKTAADLLRRARRPPRGLALISVLWVLTLLALIAASLTKTTRTEINLARNAADNARAEALADAGVYRAVLGLIETDPARQMRADGTLYAWAYGGGEIRVAVQDEGGKVDLNRATDALLAALFVAAGVGAQDAAVLADAVRDFADADDLVRANGAEDEDYAAAGLPWGAKDAAFAAVEELQQVIGVSAPLYAALAPALTVHGRKAPHEASAPPLVRAALAGAVLETAEAEEEPEEPEAPPELSETPQALAGDEAAEAGAGPRSRARVFTIHAEAKLANGAVFVREALVRLGGGAAYGIEGWKRGARVLFPFEERAAGKGE